MATLLFRLVVISIISINLSFGSDHIFSPKLGSASFLLSPRSRFIPVFIPKLSHEDIARYILSYKNGKGHNGLLLVVDELSSLAAKNRGAFEGVKKFIESGCLRDKRLFPFGENLILYGEPFGRGGHLCRVEFIIRENVGIRIHEIDADMGSDSALLRLCRLIPMSSISKVMAAQPEKAGNALGAIKKERYYLDIADELVSYGGGQFLEALFAEDPVLFVRFIDGYRKGTLLELDNLCDSILSGVDEPRHLKLRGLFKAFYHMLSIRYVNLKLKFISGTPGDVDKPYQVLRRRLEKVAPLSVKFLLRAKDLAGQLNTETDLGRWMALKAEAKSALACSKRLEENSDRLWVEYQKWVFAEEFASLLEDGPISLRIADDGSIPLGHILEDFNPVMKTYFFKEWHNAVRFIKRNNLKEIFFEPSADEEWSKRAVIGLLNLLIDGKDEGINARESILLDHDIWAGVVGGDRLSVFKVDPYDDRLTGEKQHVAGSLRPVIIYRSAFLNKDGSERFPDARASLLKLEKDTIPFFVDENLTAEGAFKELYNWAISKEIALPEDVQIPIIIPEEARGQVMRGRLPDRAFIVMLKEPKLDEVVGYKAYRFLMAFLYGTGMDEIKDIIIENDPAQNEAFDTTITITPIEVGHGYLTLAFPNPSLRESP